MDEQGIRTDLARHYLALADKGLMELASGNISVRWQKGMLISPTGAAPDHIVPEDFVYTDLQGHYEGAGKPSSEWQLHARIYQSREDAHAVVHTHSDHCVALAAHQRKLPGFHYLVGTFGGRDVPCTPYFTFGSEELAAAASHALTNRTACLLGNHGALCRGSSLERAAVSIQQLEILCRQYLLACELGEPGELSAEEWEDFFRASRHYPGMEQGEL